MVRSTRHVGAGKGAYLLADPEKGKPQVMLLAAGSEVSLCVDAYEQSNKKGIKARAVSMPSWGFFHKQDREYRNSVLPPDVTARVAVETASTVGWERYVTCEGDIIGMKTFGASAPLNALQKKFEFIPRRSSQRPRLWLK